MSRRPHWDDDLIDAVFRALSHTYRAQGWTGGIAIDLDESVYPLIAAVEDWHKAKRDSRIRTHSEHCWRWHTECAESLIEAQQKKIGELANQLLNEVPDSYIQMKARALTAEAAIARVRELHHPIPGFNGSQWCGAHCEATADGDPTDYPCETIRALDGER